MKIVAALLLNAFALIGWAGMGAAAWELVTVPLGHNAGPPPWALAVFAVAAMAVTRQVWRPSDLRRSS